MQFERLEAILRRIGNIREASNHGGGAFESLLFTVGKFKRPPCNDGSRQHLVHAKQTADIRATAFKQMPTPVDEFCHSSCSHIYRP